MTNEQLKQEAIKNAYGEYWEKVKDFVDENGWCDVSVYSTIKHLDAEFAEIENENGQFDMRPKSLAGIDNNVGWIRIKEDGSNLPDIDSKDDFWICNENLFFDWVSNAKQIHIKFNNKTATHYQPIVKPLPPIY